MILTIWFDSKYPHAKGKRRLTNINSSKFLPLHKFTWRDELKGRENGTYTLICSQTCRQKRKGNKQTWEKTKENPS